MGVGAVIAKELLEGVPACAAFVDCARRSSMANEFECLARVMNSVGSVIARSPIWRSYSHTASRSSSPLGKSSPTDVITLLKKSSEYGKERCQIKVHILLRLRHT